MAVIFDTNEFGFKDINIVVKGQRLARLQGVKFKKMVEKKALHGTGNKPVSIQNGNASFEGEIKLLQSEYRRLSNALLGDILSDTYVDIVVVFAKIQGAKIETHTIRNAQFTEAELGMDQGDKNMEITLPFIALDIISV